MRASQFIRSWCQAVLHVAAIPALLALAGCGEAEVTYKGTVTESDTAGYAFDAIANPSANRPIPDVVVTLCVANGCTTDLAPRRGDAAMSGADGAWGPLDQIFGGSAFGDTKIDVHFEAEGFEPFSYTTIYEHTSDPYGAQDFLNVRLVRLGSAKHARSSLGTAPMTPH